ncbi:copper resistance protein [Salmonella enterica]|nr:copper resistance protein [Salmonella enterica]EEJ5820095.1 copper resistance protein [Salmonella enterica]
MSIKNDGHYFCGAGGNRPDGSDEALTINPLCCCLSLPLSP